MQYKVPFVAYKLQYQNLKEEISRAIERVLSQGNLILCQDVEEFEKSLADFVGTKYAITLNSGTDALFLSLKAAGIGKDNEVITVSHSFVASISAIARAGAKPVLIEVGKDYLMDMDKVEAAITSKTRAIIPVHLNGRVCDMEKLMAIAEKNNLIVIEDAAQALGAGFNGRKAGSFGLTGCFSFYPAKILGCFGDGGAVTTNNLEIVEKVRLLRDHGQKNKREILCYGWNSRLDNLQAAVLNVKFKYLAEWTERRREIALAYHNELGNLSKIELPPGPDLDEKHFDVFQNYVIKANNRDNLHQSLKKKGVETLIKDPLPNHWQKELNLFHFKLPYTEELSGKVISLPMYPELSSEQTNYVIKCLKEFYGF